MNLMDIVDLVDLADLADLVKLMVFVDVVVLMDPMFVGRPGISGVSSGQALFWVLLYRRFCECVAVDIVIAGGGGLSIFFTIYKESKSSSVFLFSIDNSCSLKECLKLYWNPENIHKECGW